MKRAHHTEQEVAVKSCGAVRSFLQGRVCVGGRGQGGRGADASAFMVAAAHLSRVRRWCPLPLLPTRRRGHCCCRPAAPCHLLKAGLLNLGVLPGVDELHASAAPIRKRRGLKFMIRFELVHHVQLLHAAQVVLTIVVVLEVLLLLRVLLRNTS